LSKEKPANRGGLLRKWWRRKDLNLRTPKRADLQSAAIDRSATPPTHRVKSILLKKNWTFLRKKKKRDFEGFVNH
jgi:hypothetical protein